MRSSLTLSSAPDSVFRIWRNRLNIEYQAAALFGQLAVELRELYGEGDPVVQLCLQAEQEELEHAQMCIDILEYSGKSITFNYKPAKIDIGPLSMSLKQRIVYVGLAMGCVTETLSAALLTEMLSRAEEGLIKKTVHKILKDEVKHSRIGWAILNRESQQASLKWIQPYISLMLKEALDGDIEPMLSREEAQEDLSRWGILSPGEADLITHQSIETIIRPGLKHFKLSC